MPAAREWREHLYTRLEQSNFVIAVQTPSSAGRPWVMWECGVASGVMRERGLIPVVYGMGKGDLASPLSAYEVYRGDDPDQVRRICEQLAREANLQVHTAIYDLFIPAYLKAIQLTNTRKIPSAEEFAVWRNRFEHLVRSGRADEVLHHRQLMYAAFAASGRNSTSRFTIYSAGSFYSKGERIIVWKKSSSRWPLPPMTFRCYTERDLRSRGVAI